MRRRSPVQPQRDAGVTLVELLVAVLITSIIMTALVSTIITSLRTTPSVSNRADNAISVQGVTVWLPSDVDSTEPGQFDTNAASPSGCTGTDPGSNVLRLQWKETFRTISTTYVADYRYVVSGGTGQIVRVTCSGKFALGAPQVLRMSAKLSSTAPVVIPDDFDGDGKVDKVTFQIQTLSGEVVFIEAATKNPNETLPPVTTVAAPPTTTTIPSTTTTTDPSSSTTTPTPTSSTTTTIPACTVPTMTVSPNPVQLQNSGTAKLKKDVTVTIDGLAGYCVGLTLQYDTGAPNNQWVRNFPIAPPYTIVLEGHPQGTELWVPGAHVLEVRDGYNNLLNQATLVVTN